MKLIHKEDRVLFVCAKMLLTHQQETTVGPHSQCLTFRCVFRTYWSHGYLMVSFFNVQG